MGSNRTHISIGLAGSTALALATAFACVASDDPACAKESWPSATGPVLRVSAVCGQDNGDGSATRPYRTLEAAVKAAKAGDTVVVAAGTYTAGVTVPAGIHLAGAGAAAVRLETGDSPAMAIDGAGTSRISGIGVYNAKGFGISVTNGADATLVGVRVEKTLAGKAVGHQGHGVAANGAKKVTLEGCQLVGNAGVGLVVQASGPVGIIDPLFLKDPSATARGVGKVGIIDPLFVPKSQVTGNQGGGVAIIDPLFAPAGDAPVPDLTVTATDLAANGKFGIALYGAGATITRSAIRATKGNQGDAADGLIVAPRQVPGAKDPILSVKVDAASVLTGNNRAGILATAGAEVEVAAEVSLSGRGGVWAQGDKAKVRLTKAAVLAQNTMVGVAVTAGATLEVMGARVSDTKAYAYMAPRGGNAVDIADGIGVFGKARGTVRDAVIKGNPRAGVIGRDCATDSVGMPDLKIENTQISGSKYGVVIAGKYGQQNVAGAAAPKDKGNSYDGVTNESSEEDLTVQESPCDGGKPCSGAP